jgi:hypothetical protein
MTERRAPTLQPSTSDRPGQVKKLIGIIFQSDERDIIGSWFIRPIEMIDRRFAGLGRTPGKPSLAMHAGIHVQIEDGSEYVVEQLVGTPLEDFVDGLNWTPIATFRSRDRGGWDVTIPATAFRKINEAIVAESVSYLNTIQPRPFIREDCTKLVERAFGQRRLFADSPTARTLGFGLRVGDPALPLLRPDYVLDEKAEILLRAATLRMLPDPLSEWDAPNARHVLRNVICGLAVVGALTGVAYYRRRRK